MRLLIQASSVLPVLQPDTKHPNRMRFRGVLVRLDESSSKPPSGAQGHLINVSSGVAHKRLDTLIGMGLNYDASLERHAQRRKVGVIQKAWIEGQDLWVSGTVWKKDFPEAEQDLKQSGLGMSMEIGNVKVADQNARVWELTDFVFTGATILRQTAAAYRKTLAIAAQAHKEGRDNMATTKKKVASKSESGVAASILEGMRPFLVAQRQTLKQIAAGQEATNKNLEKLLARGEDEEEVEVDAEEALELDAEDDAEVDAEEDVDAEDAEEEDEEEDEEEVEASNDNDREGAPGNINKGAKNRGNKTYSMNRTGPTISKGITAAGLAKVLANAMAPIVQRLDKQDVVLASMRKKMKSTNTQIAAAAAQTTRRSVQMLDPTTVSLLARNHVDVGSLEASGQKLSVEEVDGILGQTSMNSTDRMAVKNKLLAVGLMDEGHVRR